MAEQIKVELVEGPYKPIHTGRNCAIYFLLAPRKLGKLTAGNPDVGNFWRRGDSELDSKAIIFQVFSAVILW